jgi:hypothetical protein
MKAGPQTACPLMTAVVLVCQVFAQSQTPTPRAGRRAVSLTKDQRDLYVALLDQYVSTFKRFAGANPEFINLVDTTVPLDLADDLKEDKGCFSGITFDNLKGARKETHKLDTIFESWRESKLVDDAQQAAIRQAITQGMSATTVGQLTLQANLLQVSEIAFDKDHRFAAIRYTFSCGALCGKGGVVIFETFADGWRNANRPCAGWIS